jgi:MFS family permease
MKPDRRRLLRNSGFRNLWLAGWISLLGSEAGGIAIFLFLFQNGDSLSGLAAFAALRTLPASLIAPLAGVAVDRFDKRRLMIAADLVRCALLAAAITNPSPALLYLVAVLSSLSSAFFDAARGAALPAIAGPSRVAAANGLDQSMWNLTRIAGPVAGALLLARFGLSAALALDAATFAASALLLLRVPPVAPPIALAAPVSAWPGTRDGWIYLRSHAMLRHVILLWLLSTLAVGMWIPLAPFFNSEALHTGSEALGYQIAGFGAAGALGGVAASALSRRYRPGILLAAAMIIEGTHVVLYSFAPGVRTSILILLPWGFVVAVIFVVAQSLIQTRADPAFLGRVLSTMQQAEHLATLGSMAAAVLLIRIWSARTIFRAAGVFYIAAVGASLLLRGGRALLSIPRLEPSAGEGCGDGGHQDDALEPERLAAVVEP